MGARRTRWHRPVRFAACRLAMCPTWWGRRDARELKAVTLHEVSLVAVGMNDRARVTSIKAIDGAGDIADLLRAGGVSGRRAKAAAGLAWKAINDSDDDDAAQIALVGAMARLKAL